MQGARRARGGRIGHVLYGLALALAFASFLASSWSHHRDVRFHVDETYWMAEGVYLKLFFYDLDLTNDAWRDYWGRRNPPLVKYVYGVATLAAGHPIVDFELRDVYGRLWSDGAALEAETPAPVLAAGRLASWGFGLASAILLVVVSPRIGSRWIGPIAVLLLSRDAHLMSYFVRAMSESIVSCLTLVYLTASLRFFRRDRSDWRDRRDRWAMSAMAGSIALLALAKPSGGLAGIVFAVQAAGFHALPVWRGVASDARKRAAVTWLRVVAVVGVLSLLLLVAFNPWLYRNPPGHLLKTNRSWGKHVAAQQERWPDAALHTLPEKLSFYADHVFPVKAGSASGELLNLAILAAGLAALAIRGVRRSRQSGRLAPELVFLIWGLVYAFAQILWLPLRWPRYVLVSHPFVILLQAAGLVALATGSLSVARSGLRNLSR